MTREMTEEERHVELDRQLRAGDQIFCPWCTALNAPGMQPCCHPFSAALDKRGADQLQFVIDQYTAVEVGMTDSITCPYCGKLNTAPDSSQQRHPSEWPRPLVSPFCCDLMQMAAYAVIERKRTQAYMEKAEKIGEGIAKAGRN